MASYTVVNISKCCVVVNSHSLMRKPSFVNYHRYVNIWLWYFRDSGTLPTFTPGWVWKWMAQKNVEIIGSDFWIKSTSFIPLWLKGIHRVLHSLMAFCFRHAVRGVRFCDRACVQRPRSLCLCLNVNMCTCHSESVRANEGVLKVSVCVLFHGFEIP